MFAIWSKGSLKEETSRIRMSKELAFGRTPMMYLKKSGYHTFTSRMTNAIQNKKELAFGRTPMMYLKKAGYNTFTSRMTNAIKKKKVLVSRLIQLRESMEKLDMDVKGVLIEQLRAISILVKEMVFEYFRHVKKGFDDQVSHYHFISFLAIVSSFLLFVIDKLRLGDYLNFLFKAKENPIDVLTKEVQDLGIEQKEFVETYKEDHRILIGRLARLAEIERDLQLAISGLTERAHKSEISIEELRADLVKLKEKTTS